MCVFVQASVGGPCPHGEDRFPENLGPFGRSGRWVQGHGSHSVRRLDALNQDHPFRVFAALDGKYIFRGVYKPPELGGAGRFLQVLRS